MSKKWVSLLVAAITLAMNINAALLDGGVQGWSVGFSNPDIKGSPIVVSFIPGEVNRLKIDARGLPEGQRLTGMYLGVQNVVSMTTADPGASYRILSQTPGGYAFDFQGSANVVTFTTTEDLEYRQLLTVIGALGVVNNDEDRYGGYYAIGAPMTAVPEPEYYALAVAGIAIGFVRWHRHNQQTT